MAVTANRPSPAEISSKVDEALKDYLGAFPDPVWQEYLPFHRRRYQLLMALVVKLIDSDPAPDGGFCRILDVGPRFEVDLIHRLLPDVPVDTVGLNEGLFPARGDEQRLEFDLNDADLPEGRPALGGYELIVMAEVLEHLHMPPSVVLGWIGSLLKPGGRLVVQTPNAVTLPHRLRMLAGRNPYGQLSANRASPGHIREYTTKELAAAGKALGLEVEQLSTANYFTNRRPINRVFQRLERVVPSTLRAGISVVYRAPAS